ncbi:MAG: signal peptidase II [Nitrospirae bacterium]|nr:signal peptidase II [Nitrospirota bacterium]
MNKYFLSGSIALVVVITDQITKSIIKANIPLYKSIPVVDGFFNITHVKNTGGAFGILSGMNSLFFIIASSIALLIVIVYLIRLPENNLWLITSLSLISGGAIGNMIDRVRSGEVIDFIDLFYDRFHWPAFNIADSSITIGVFILFINLLTFRKEK